MEYESGEKTGETENYMERGETAEGIAHLGSAFVIYGFIFYYLPLGGWIMAFQNYKPKTGLLHSKFIGLDKFNFYLGMQPLSGLFAIRWRWVPLIW